MTRMMTATFAALLLTAMSVFGADYETRIQPRLDELTKQLALNAEQVSKVKDILIGQEQLREVDIQRYADDPGAMVKADAERKEIADEQFLEVLSEAQWVKYQEMPVSSSDASEPPSLKQRTQELVTRLKLNDEQAAKIDAIFAKYADKMPTPGQGGGMGRGDGTGSGQGEGRGQMRQIMEEMDEKIAAVLTDDQKAEYEKYKNERREERRGRMGGRGRF